MPGPTAGRRLLLIDCKDLDEAIDVASQVPGARTGTIEVRPIWGLEVERAPIEIAKESSVATTAPTSSGVVLARSCAAPFMVVPDSSEVAMSKLAQTTLVTQAGVVGDRLSSTTPHASPQYRRTHP